MTTWPAYFYARHRFLRAPQIPRAMRRADLLRRKVEDLDVTRVKGAAALVEGMGRGGGFTAKKIADGVEILRTMVRRPGCFTFLSFPAALMATGVRGVLRTLVERKLVDAVLTTCGTADHDLARGGQGDNPRGLEGGGGPRAPGARG